MNTKAFTEKDFLKWLTIIASLILIYIITKGLLEKFNLL